MQAAHEQGIANVLVTNGCIRPAAAEKILSLTDAANIDLKCFSEKTYTEILGGDLKTVLDFIRLAHKKGVHTELTTLVIPGLNDTEAELENCTNFIAALSEDWISRREIQGVFLQKTPWHLSAYHPDWKWKAPPTESKKLLAATERARKKLTYVYAGNIAGESADLGFDDTLCPSCGKVLVKRRGYRVDPGGLTLQEQEGGAAYFCAHCGAAADFRS
jgi:pyruvate formate lyase activating enzyme